MSTPVSAVIFDIIETCFSLEPARGALRQAGMPGEALETWFARSLRDGFALAAADSFTRFRDILGFNLEEIAASHGVVLAADARDAILARFGRLPPQPETVKAYGLLHDAGIPVIALSNGAAAGTTALLEGAGLKDRVAHILSVEDITAFKPRAEVYRHAAAVAGLEPSSIVLVATHAWDVHGAKRAGLMGGFVARGQRYPDWMEPPDFVGEDLVGLVTQMI